MQNWQKKRNYRRQHNEDGRAATCLITVDSITTSVPDDVFDVYASGDRRERYLDEAAAANQQISLEKALEDHLPIERMMGDPCLSAEDILVEREAVQDDRAHLAEAMRSLTEEEQRLIEAIFRDGVSVRQFARSVGLSKSTVSQKKIRILKKIKKNFQKNTDT